ncbi:Sec-independent protein translocase subunit TatA [Nocardia sp. NPDC127579]|uniref:Sec-independent protein translocase subunit TatA n=1 Tax=Nocardia sp. NPDC127579 TaxID=3345402 RepID=UPI003636A00A
MGAMSATHWLIIAAAFLILFGARRLPDAARSMGRSLRIFRSEMNELHTDSKSAAEQSGAPADSVVRTMPEARRSAASG